MNYTPHTEEDIKKMLKSIGVSCVEELFDVIPQELRAQSFELPESMSEQGVSKEIERLLSLNGSGIRNFAGGGFYDHYIPSAVDFLSSRSEFYTPYTPYQSECSQGTLQALYEYQSAICRLTGMDVSNASVYDGGTAAAEAVLMALNITRNRRKIIIDSGVNPLYREIIHTYTENLNIEIVEVDSINYRADRKKLKGLTDKDTAAVLLQNPNFFGAVDDYTDIVAAAAENGALSILLFYPVSLGVLKTPGEMGFDIAAGEGQSLGIPLSFGGPYLGILAACKKYLRKLPGRIAGAAQDSNGRRGYVLSMQAREQHIRREKATSNICTNQNLMALRALLYMVLTGKSGFVNVSKKNLMAAAKLKETIAALKTEIEIPFYGPVYNEFVIKLPVDARAAVKKMLQQKILAGVPLGDFYPGRQNELLVCATESSSDEDFKLYTDALENLLKL